MAPHPHLKPATVLIVENEALVRLELADWLSKSGIAVFAATNADEAIVLLDAHPGIEILLTNIKMPGSMDGVRLSHHVRHRWPPVQIIVMSGLVNTRLSDLPPGSLFLSKPYAREALREALAHMISSGPRSAGPPAKLIA